MESRLARSDNGWFTPVQFVDYGAEAFSSHLLFRQSKNRRQRGALARIDRVRLTGEGRVRRCDVSHQSPAQVPCESFP
jgi:hypothetical protein